MSRRFSKWGLSILTGAVVFILGDWVVMRVCMSFQDHDLGKIVGIIGGVAIGYIAAQAATLVWLIRSES